MAAPDFRTALEQVDRELGEGGMPPDVNRRIRERLDARAARGSHPWIASRRLWLAGCAVAVLALGVTLGLRARRSPGPAPLAGFDVLAASADLEAAASPDGTVAIRRGTCTLREPRSGENAGAGAGTRLRVERRGVRVLEGTVAFAVDKRPAGAEPAAVFVSGGLIEIMGTRFTVTETGRSGRVALLEGSIRFTPLAGAPRTLRPGMSETWPAVPATAPVAAPGTAHPSAASEKATVDALLYRIASLRSRNLYPQAVAELQQALGQDFTPATKERLDFELGSILTYQIGDRSAACRVWRAHAERYPRGRYAREVSQAEDYLGCRR